MHNIPAVIFAGGKSSRMGTDKALLPFNGYETLSQFQYKRLQDYFDTVYISCKENKFNFPCELILDTQDISSPLIALVSVFEQLKCESVFILSVDAPLVNEQIINSIFEANDVQYDAVIAQSPKGIQPLCGIYHRSILPFAKRALKNDIHKLTTLLNTASSHKVIFNEELPFTNLNHKEEYESLFSRYL